MKPRFVHFLPAIFWFGLIAILLTLPGKDIPKSDFFELVHFDKWVHTGLFAVLVFLFSYPLKDQFFYKSFPYIMITVLSVLYGIIMEYVQEYFTVDRTFDITDMMADAAGACIGYFIFRLISAKLSQKNKPL